MYDSNHRLLTCILCIAHFSATGFIGLPTAQALARAGHIVYGLARTEAKAKLLVADESAFVASSDKP
jgi:nucleoside-diphosphate-sugar epimerase